MIGSLLDWLFPGGFVDGGYAFVTALSLMLVGAAALGWHMGGPK